VRPLLILLLLTLQCSVFSVDSSLLTPFHLFFFYSILFIIYKLLITILRKPTFWHLIFTKIENFLARLSFTLLCKKIWSFVVLNSPILTVLFANIFHIKVLNNRYKQLQWERTQRKLFNWTQYHSFVWFC